MEEIKLKNLDLSIYTKTLDNGLEIYFIPYEDKNNYFITYATRYGSTITEFTPTGEKKQVKVPDGIAHFLEHKMFEQPSGEDPFTFFSKSGTGANASTSYDSTQYICYGTKKFNENLNYLLDFVNTPYYTDENVEKEKGIIAEELNMYMDIPDFKLDNRLKECVYKNHPRRIDIGGTVEEINKITKEDLYLCYNNFYTPNNMFILIAGNFNMDKALESIENKLSDKKNIKLPKISMTKEPIKTNIKEDTFEADINIPKLGYAIKIPTKDLSIKEGIELDLYLSMLTSILFGPASEFREKLRQEKLINGIYTEWESIKGYKTFYITSSTEDIDKLIELINDEIDETAFERIKKVWIANEVKITDYIEATVSNTYDDIIRYKKIIPNRIELIRKLKLNKLNKLVSEINFNNKTIVKMLPKDKN